MSSPGEWSRTTGFWAFANRSFKDLGRWKSESNGDAESDNSQSRGLVLYLLSYSTVDEPIVHSVHTVRWIA